jgi:hypothetical protein
MSEWAAHLGWALGGEARVVAIAADSVTLESTTPAPPGSRIEGTLRSASGVRVRVKVHSAKKDPATGRFRIDGRPIDLTREGRAELEGLVGR